MSNYPTNSMKSLHSRSDIQRLMQLLNTPYLSLPFAHRTDRGHYTRRSRKRRNKRHFVFDGSPPYLILRDTRYFPARSIDDELYFPVLDRIDNVRSALAHFTNGIDRDTMLSKESRRSIGRDDLKSKF